MQPLTHHEILGLVEPFTRSGRHVDLAASNRLERRLVFKPVHHPAAGPDCPALHELLRLENPEPDHFELTRVLALECGMEAMLQTEGREPGELLARIESVAPRRQIIARPREQTVAGRRRVAGIGEHEGACPLVSCTTSYVIAQSHRLEGDGTAAGRDLRLRLTTAVARVDGLTLNLKVSRVVGVPADLELVARPGDTIELPEDVFAVLGWPWSRLTPSRGQWVGCLRLRRREPERSRDAERKLERTAQHLAMTLAEPPARFHERLFAARWRVTLRRAIPLLVCLGLVPATLAVPQLDLAENSIVRMLLFHAPPLLLLLFVALPEMPRIEFPPLPRRPRSPSWRRVPSPEPPPGEGCSPTR